MDSEEPNQDIERELQWGVDKLECDRDQHIVDYKGSSLVILEGLKLSDAESAIRDSDCIIFDYGGMSQPWMGGDHFIDRWNRFFIKMIKDYPSKLWLCISALSTFESEDRRELKALGVYFRW